MYIEGVEISELEEVVDFAEGNALDVVLEGNFIAFVPVVAVLVAVSLSVPVSLSVVCAVAVVVAPPSFGKPDLLMSASEGLIVYVDIF